MYILPSSLPLSPAAQLLFSCLREGRGGDEGKEEVGATRVIEEGEERGRGDGEEREDEGLCNFLKGVANRIREEKKKK